jgi:GNAT superfamily N-acetyltransferase
MTTVIASAVPDTVPELVRSVAALFEEDGGQRDPHMDTQWPKRDGTAYYLAATRDPKCLCLVAQHGTDHQSVVGHLIGRLARPDALRPEAVQVVLESMRVDPTHRLQGVGAILVDHFREWGRTKGANEASVTAYMANVPAIQFYRGCGFDPFELTLHMAL